MEVLRQKALFLSRVRSLTKVAIALSSTVALVGCGGFAEWIAVRVFYREAVLVRAQVYKDLNYWADLSADQHKHRLDFYVPEGGTGWSVLIFVHGGGWRRGDKALKFGHTDFYGNIGRLRYSGDRRGHRQLPFAAGGDLARPGQGRCSGVSVDLSAWGGLRRRQALHIYIWPFIGGAASDSGRPGSQSTARIAPSFLRSLRRDCSEWCTFRHFR